LSKDHASLIAVDLSQTVSRDLLRPASRAISFVYRRIAGSRRPHASLRPCHRAFHASEPYPQKQDGGLRV